MNKKNVYCLKIIKEKLLQQACGSKVPIVLTNSTNSKSTMIEITTELKHIFCLLCIINTLPPFSGLIVSPSQIKILEITNVLPSHFQIITSLPAYVSGFSSRWKMSNLV